MIELILLRKLTKLFNCARILDTQLWPMDKDDLIYYGNELVRKAASHYMEHGLLDGHNVDAIVSEWNELKNFVADNLIKLKPPEIWVKIHKFYQDKFQLIETLINILRVYPFSNAAVERCFSCMNKVKTDWRAHLGEETLDTLVRVKKMGPIILDFDPTSCVDIFFSKQRRPNTQPYGPRAAKQIKLVQSVANANI